MVFASGLIVTLYGLVLVAFSGVAVRRPDAAGRFLRTFAGTARAHYTEQAVRLVVGAALVLFAPEMWYPGVFRAFGVLVLATTAGLLLLPWRWHRAVAERAIPFAIRNLKALAFGAFLLGLLILSGASRALG